MAARYYACFKIEFLPTRFSSLAEEELRGAMNRLGFSKLNSYWQGDTDLYVDELRRCIHLTIFPNLGLSSKQAVVDLTIQDRR
jgi:hypothetical protein